ncbi:MAG: PD40 domain-containing protein [Anaerolineae bacterium]|nr:PD40 domain-containing protein [Anaerolineae bacterium]
MKKQTFSIILTLVICLCLLVPIRQAEARPPVDTPPEVLRAILTGSSIPVKEGAERLTPKPERADALATDRSVALAGLPGRIAFMSDRDGDWEIFVMNADGSSLPTQLTLNTSDDYTPRWSPDGSKIVFTSNRTGDLDVYVMNADGSGQINRTNYPFADDALPDWSPDGSKIAFCSNRGGSYDIYVMNADGSKMQRLTYLSTDAMGPTWSPDGSKIAFMVYIGYDIWYGPIWDIYTMDADGSHLMRLTENSLMNCYPDYSPDGQRITFSSTRAGDNDVFVMNSDGSQQLNLTYDSIYQEWYSTWSPDGTKLAYTFDDDLVGPIVEGDDIYIMNPDGTQRVNLTNDPTTSHNRAPSWGIGGVETFSISGHVRDGSGNPISGVVVSAGAAGSATTDGNGAYTITGLAAGTYTLTPSKSGWTFSPATRTVSVPPDATGQDFVGSSSGPPCNVTKQPVLLVHGWGAPDRLEDDTGGFEKLYKWMQADGYVEACNCFYATGVKASNSRDQNADAIQSSLRRAYDTFSALNPAWRGHFDIIGHSYGGLNARFYLESPRYADDAHYGQYGIHVDNLFTLGSPHGGVATTELFPGAVGVGYKYLNSEKWRSAVGLTEIAMFAYNVTHEQPSGVHYRLVGGDFLSQPNVPLLVKLMYAPWALIPNDAAVSQRSSLLLGSDPLLWLRGYRSVSLHPNTDMHGYSDRFGLSSVRSYVNPDTTYREVIAPHPGALAYVSAAGEPAIVGTQTGSDVPQPLLIASEVITGGQIINGNVLADWSGQSVFYAKWMDGNLDLTLSDPTGYVITPSVAASDPNVDYDKGALGAVSLATYSMTNTVTGNWSYTVTAPSGPYPILFDLYVIPDSPLVLRASVADWHPFGAPVVITANLTYSSTPLSDVTVQAHVTRPDESKSTITLHDDGVTPDDTAGDGIYSGTFADTTLGGYYYVLTEADGMYAAQPYHRTAQEVFTVASQDAALSGAYSDRTEDTNGDGQYEYLIVDVGMNAAQSGDYLVSAVLESVDGQYIDLANASVASASGPLTLSLYFSGDAIRESGIDGPYVVTQVLLLDDASLIKLDEAYDAWMTAAYNHDHFGGPRQVYLPIVLKNH